MSSDPDPARLAAHDAAITDGEVAQLVHALAFGRVEPGGSQGGHVGEDLQQAGFEAGVGGIGVGRVFIAAAGGQQLGRGVALELFPLLQRGVGREHVHALVGGGVVGQGLEHAH